MRVCAWIYVVVTFVALLMLCNEKVLQAWTAVCLFCRVSVRTFHLSRLLIAGVHAPALIRVLWTCRLIAEEAEQVITFESLIAQTRTKKNTRQGGRQPTKITCSSAVFWVVPWCPAGLKHQDTLITGLSIQMWDLSWCLQYDRE